MKICEIIDENGNLFAIEVRNDLFSTKTILKILSSMPEITNVHAKPLFLGLFNFGTEIRMEFDYKGSKYNVTESYGDNNYYWIGPFDLTRKGSPQQIQEIKELYSSFRDYRFSPIKKFLLDLTSLDFQEIQKR